MNNWINKIEEVISDFIDEYGGYILMLFMNIFCIVVNIFYVPDMLNKQIEKTQLSFLVFIFNLLVFSTLDNDTVEEKILYFLGISSSLLILFFCIFKIIF